MNTSSYKTLARLANIPLLILAGLALLAGPRQAAAQGTAFSYSGILDDGGLLATGVYDFTFLLSASSNITLQVGSTITNISVPVSNGVFTVTLNFGVGVFGGNPLWLEIGVRTNGASNFLILGPLQPITPVPYAIMAGAASNLIGTLPASQLPASVSNQLSNAALLNGTNTFTAPNFYAGVVTATNTGNTFAGSLTGNATSATTADMATNFLGGLMGDVTGTQGATTVSFVGEVAAASLAAGANAANRASSSSVPGAIVSRDATGSFSAGTVTANAFAGNGSNLTALNAGSLASGTVPLALLPASILTNNEIDVSLNGAFSGNASGLTNYEAANLAYSVSTSAPIAAGGTNFSLDFSYTKVIWILTTNACISNTLHATSGDNHMEVWIRGTNATTPFVMSWLPGVNLVGAFTTNGLPITNSAGFWVMAVSQFGTNWQTNTCTYAIAPPNR
jgi:hypothetical protein